MAAKTNAAKTDTSDREIVLVREIHAPRDLVFSTWTSAEHLSQWWGPNGFTTTTQKMEFREGGSWKYIMHGPDGTDYDNRITYREIKAPEFLAYDHGGDDGKVYFQVTVTFEALSKEKTRLTMHSVFPSAEARNLVVEKFGAIEGGQQTIGRMEDYLKTLAPSPGVRPFVISRTFKAPIELMFDVWTQVEHLQKWFGPKGAKTLQAKMDFRPGGMYHYGMEFNGQKMWGRFVYKEIQRPNLVVYLNSFSDADGGIGHHPFAPDWPAELLTTIRFTEHVGYTTVKIEWLPVNASEKEIQAFEAARPGMNQGWGGTFEQLDEYLKSSQ